MHRGVATEGTRWPWRRHAHHQQHTPPHENQRDTEGHTAQRRQRQRLNRGLEQQCGGGDLYQTQRREAVMARADDVLPTNPRLDRSNVETDCDEYRRSRRHTAIGVR